MAVKQFRKLENVNHKMQNLANRCNKRKCRETAVDNEESTKTTGKNTGYNNVQIALVYFTAMSISQLHCVHVSGRL